MHGFRPFVLAISCLALLPTLARAQAGLLAGMTLESGERDFSRGYSLTGTFEIRRTARVGFRFDLGYQTFARSTFYLTAPCPPPSVDPTPCGAGPGRGDNITALSTTASVVLTENPGRNSFYWVAGLGVYAFTRTPSDGAYRRLGWNAGGGFNLGPNVVVELRYHGLFDPRTTRALIPITLGFRF
jgi:hypothetical protein